MQKLMSRTVPPMSLHIFRLPAAGRGCSHVWWAAEERQLWGQPHCGSGEFNGLWLNPTRLDAKIRVWHAHQTNPCYALSQPPANQFIPIHSSATRSKHDHCLSLCASLPRFRKISVLASSPPAGPRVYLQFYHPIPELLRDISDCPCFNCN